MMSSFCVRVIDEKGICLEREPQAELNFARRISTRNIAEIARQVVGANRLGVDSIEDIEKVCTEGQAGLLAEFPAFVCRNVIILVSRVFSVMGSGTSLDSDCTQVNNVLCVDIWSELSIPAQARMQRVIVQWTGEIG